MQRASQTDHAKNSQEKLLPPNLRPRPPWKNKAERTTLPELFLSDSEIDCLCAPLTQPAAQVRYLRSALKLTVSTKPNGRALLVRSHAELVLSGGKAGMEGDEHRPNAKPQPNIAGFLQVVQNGRRHGKAAQQQSA